MTEELSGGCLDERAIRDALAAGPTPGPWLVKGRVHTSGEAIRIESHHPADEHHLYQVCDVLDANDYPRNQANLRFIAACNPVAITALLAELDTLRASLSTSKQAGAEPVEYLRAVGDGTHELVGKHERGAFPVYATPPAVMPAAPSDAVELDRQKVDGKLSYTLRDDEGNVRIGNFPITADQFNAIAAILEAAPGAALSQTMQPQAERSFAVTLGEESIRSFAEPTDGQIDPVLASAYERDYTKAIKEAKRWAEFIPEIRGNWSAESVIALLGNLVIGLRAAGEQAGVVAWQERQVVDAQGNFTDWYESSSELTRSKAEAFTHLSGDTTYEFRPLFAAPGAAIAAREQEAEAFLRQMASVPGTIIRSSRDLSPQASTNARASSNWLTLRDGLGFAILAEHARQMAEEEQPPCAKCSSPNDCMRLGCAALTQPTTVQQADALARKSAQVDVRAILEPNGVYLTEKTIDVIVDAVLKTAQTTALNGGNGEGES